MGVLNNKHIPDVYKRASVDQRIALVQGLMDTDGSVTSRGQFEFNNTNKRLVDDLREILRSLGVRSYMAVERAYLSSYDGTECRIHRLRFTPEINLAWLPRKSERFQPLKQQPLFALQGIQPVASVPVRCIQVDSPSSTFLVTRGYVPTHNSGLLNVIPPDEIKKYNRSLGQLHLKNGALLFSFSGADPEKLRGFQSHYIWMDELAAWQYERETFDQALMGLRLGPHPRIVITTTPKPSPLVVELVNRSRLEPERVRLVTGSTFDNAANLPDSTLASLRARYENTTLGRQELYAELILDDPNALWKRDQLEADRLEPETFKLHNMAAIVVAIDPSMSESGSRATETGIVVVGRGHDGKAYLIEDASIERPSPDTWARIAVTKYHQYSADKVVAEVNQGYDLVKYTLGTVDPLVPVKKVYSRRGKDLRAQPIAALAEQHRIKHYGNFFILEDQLTQWVPGTNQASPDRLDAYVHGMTELMLGGGVAEMYSPSALPRLPSTIR